MLPEQAYACARTHALGRTDGRTDGRVGGWMDTDRQAASHMFGGLWGPAFVFKKCISSPLKEAPQLYLIIKRNS